MVGQTQRQYIYAIQAAQVVAEFCLDKGTIAAGGQSTAFCELEVELLDGQPRADLDTLIELLQARYTLVPEMLGKMVRGLALLAASDGGMSIFECDSKHIYQMLA